MAMHLKANRDVSQVEPANHEFFTLKELQGYVGGTIELLPVTNGCYMIVNEEGRWNGTPPNENATKTAILNGFWECVEGDVITGDVIVLSKDEWDAANRK